MTKAAKADMGSMSKGGSKTNDMSEKDAEDAKKRLAAVQEVERLKDLEKLKEEKKLNKVKVNKEDVVTLMNEFLLSKADATLALKKSGLESGTGDLDAAMRSLVNAL